MKRSRVRKVWVFGAVLFVLVLSRFSEAVEPPAIEWRNNLGGNKDDMAYSVQQTPDGGYIVAGQTESFGAGDLDAYLIKTDSNGNLLWQKNFGEEMKEETVWSVQQTTDNGYIMVGWKKSLSDIYLRDIYLVKTDSSGELQWEKTLGGDLRDFGLSVQQTSDGGYIITGETELSNNLGSALCLIKTNSNGDQQWWKNFGRDGDEIGYSVQQTSDGGYIITGQIEKSFGAGVFDVYLVKTDSSGELQWEKIFGGDKNDMGYSVQQTSDGGYIIAGETRSFPVKGYESYKAYKAYLIKTDSSGELQWQKIFGKDWIAVPGFLFGYWSGAYSVQQTFDDGYILAGWQMDMDMVVPEVYLVRTDTSGNLLWQENIKGITSGFSIPGPSAYARSIYQTSDGGYIVAGLADTEIEHYQLGPPDVYLIKIAPEGKIPTIVENQEEESGVPKAFALFQNYPNPFNPATEINFVLPNTSYVTLKVFNSLGRKIAILVDGKRGAGKYLVTWDGTNFPSGVYFYCLETEGFSKTMKMMLMK